MYENEQIEFLRQYGQVAETLYKIAVLVTGKPDLSVHVVENAVAECYAAPEKEPFDDKIYRYLWEACKCVDVEWGYSYRKALCALRGLNVDAGCPVLIDAMSKREKEERMVLALIVLGNRTSEQIAPLFDASKAEVERAVKKICKLMYFNKLS
jgi:hypothetical protein